MDKRNAFLYDTIMQKPKIIILKIGGSVITKKDLPTPQIEEERLQSIARILACSFDPQKMRLVLIHGAGSFGHIMAKKYGLAEGTKGHPEKKPEALKVQASVKKLHKMCLRIFKTAGLPVVSFLTHKVAVNTKGKLAEINTESIRMALKKNEIPLLYGDMIPDTEWGYSICSGDVLAAKLAKDFQVESVFFASDVDGIFTKDPHIFPDARLIPTTTLSEILSGQISLEGSHNTDVTGGLKSKFLLFQHCSALKNIYLFNGLKLKNFSSLFQKNFSKSSASTRIQVSN